jgi:hypothetical protein
MPVRDWTRVDAGIFHHFHTVWLGLIPTALNQGLLPPGHYALIEQVAGRAIADVLTLHTGAPPAELSPQAPWPPATGGIAVAEAPPRVQRRQTVEVEALARRRALASYAAGPKVEIYLEHLAAGDALAEMPLFLRPDRYINVPLEATYQQAYAGMPGFWRDVLEGREQA